MLETATEALDLRLYGPRDVSISSPGIAFAFVSRFTIYI